MENQQVINKRYKIINKLGTGGMGIVYKVYDTIKDKTVALKILKYLNEKGEEILEEFKGFNAQIVLHEIDHLDGILFVDRLLEDRKPLYKVEDDEWEEVELI